MTRTNPTAPGPLDSLKMAGLNGSGRAAPRQGVVIDLKRGPQNRAQRRLLARMRRRGTLP